MSDLRSETERRSGYSLSRLGGSERASAVVAFGEDGCDTWSYGELERAAGRLAAGLKKAGLQPGQTVAMLAMPTPAWIAVALAVFRSGAVVVPIDAQMADTPLLHALEDADPTWLFTDERGARRLGKLETRARPKMLRLDEDKGKSSWKSLLAEDVMAPESGEPDQRAIIFYTSGTTGPPKGVPLTRANVMYQFDMIRETRLIESGDCMLLPLPLHHVYPFVIGLLAPLQLGLAIVIPFALTGPELVRAIRDGEVSVVLGVPRLYRSLINGIRDKAEKSGVITKLVFRFLLRLNKTVRSRLGWNPGRALFGSLHRKLGGRLRLMASGGAPLDPDLAADIEGLGWDLAVGYGLTETSPLLTLLRPGQGHLDTVGPPVYGTELKVDPSADPGRSDATRPDPAGSERGEVLARGPGVFGGYHNLPDLSSKVLRDGWFRTGDLGWFDQDGFLHLEGRVSTMLVLEGGENIAPDTLEDLYGQCEDIAEIGVLQRDGKLVALIVPADHVPKEEAEERIKTALRGMRDRVPSYQRIARFKRTRHALPRTRLGKIRRHELEERYDGADQEEAEGKRGPISIKDMSSDDRSLLDNEHARKLWELLARRYADQPLEPESRMESDLGVDSMEWVDLSIAIESRLGFSLGSAVMGKAETVHDLLEAATQATERRGGDSMDILRNPDAVLDEEDRKRLEPRPAWIAVIGRVIHFLHEPFMRLYYRVELEGREHLPREGPYVLAPNHVSYLDSSALITAIGRRVVQAYYWAGLTDVMFRNPIMRLISRIGQVVPIDPKRGPISSLALGAAVLKRGQAMVWFPEGGRSLDGTLQRFRPGLGLILHEYPDVPVLPVAIIGTYESLPPGRTFPRPGRIVVRIGSPLTSADLEKAGEGESAHQRITHALREAVNRLIGST